MNDEHANRWLDAELSRVPLPEGLLARLRALAASSDEVLDAALREVVMPAGLTARLAEIPADEALDQALAAVPVPAEMLERLRHIPADAMVDELLREVPAPAAVLARARRIPVVSLRRHEIWQMAVAASLIFVISSAYLLGVAGLIGLAYHTPGERPAPLVLAPTAIQLEAGEARVELPPPPAAEAGEAGPPALAGAGEPAPWQPDPPDLRAGPAEQFLAALGPQPLAELTRLRWGVLGAPPRAEDRLLQLEAVVLPRPRGIAPPLSRSYDRAFLLRTGVHPVVSLAGSAPLKTVAAPLSTGTFSFDEAAAAIAQGRLPAADEIRIEDFLAAVEYDFPPPRPGTLALRTAAGPSPFGDPAVAPAAEGGPRLMQVAVKAGQALRRDGPPVRLIVAVDVSDAMRPAGRLEGVRRGLRSLVRHLRADDRLALVAFADEAYVLIEEAGPEDAADWSAAAEILRPGGGAHLGEGLQAAGSLALYAAAGAPPAQVLLVSGGTPPMADAAFARCEAFAAELAASGAAVSCLDLSGLPGGDPRLVRLAAAGGGRHLQPAEPEDARRLLIETLLGGSSLVAQDAVLRIELNPRAVLAYRLLGHAPAAVGLLPVALETPLFSLEEASVLLELWLSSAGGDDVAQAEVVWRDPATGAPRRQTQRISRLQFAGSLAEAPLSLQAACIAAATAEVLGESPFAAGRVQSLDGVLAAAEQVNPRLMQRPSFVRLVETAEAARRLRTARPR